MSYLGCNANALVDEIRKVIPDTGDDVTANLAGEINLEGGNDISTVGTALTNTISIAITGTTENSVQIGDNTGGIESIAVGTNGQVLIGATAADPAFGTLTSTGGTIAFTTGANTLNLETVGAVATSYLADDLNSAVPALGVLVVAGGANIYTSAAIGGTLTIDLNGTTDHALQVGNATGSLTSLGLGLSTQVLHGNAAGDPTWGAVDLTNEVTGYLPVGSGGTGVGSITAHSLVVGDGSSAINEIAVGATNQVLLGNTAADPSWGSVPNAALTNSSVTLSNGNNITVTGSPVSLGGTASFDLTGCTQYSIQVGDATGSLDSLATGTATQMLQSGGAAANPAWSTTTWPATTTQGDVLYSSSDNTIASLAKDATATRYLANTGASNNPAWNQVNMANGVTGTLPVANGGTGFATTTAYAVLCGGTSATNPFQPIAGVGTADQVLTSNGAGALPTFQDASGGLPAGGLTGEGLMANTGVTATWEGSPSYTGTVTAGTGLTATTGNITATSGSLLLPTTSATDGQVQINGTRFAHSYGSRSTFIGSGCGNFTLTGVANTGIGANGNLSALTTGGSNSMFGDSAGSLITSGDHNVGNGQFALGQLTTTDYNLGIGWQAGTNLLTGYNNVLLGGAAGKLYTSNESSNIVISGLTAGTGVVGESNKIRIGSQGSGVGEQDTCYIAGIYGTTVGATYKIATVDNAHKLGGTTIVPVDHGGTGIATTTAYAVLCGGTTATGAFQPVASVGTAAQVLTSNGAGALPTFQDASGGGGITWSVETGSTKAMAVSEAYFANYNGALAFTLPSTAAVGDTMQIAQMYADKSWSLAQNAGQTCYVGNTNTTTGVGGSLTSTDDGDWIEIVCRVADTDFQINIRSGNITVV